MELLTEEFCDTDIRTSEDEYLVKLVSKATLIYSEERKLNEALDTYLITFSPHPSENPDCDFPTQAAFWTNLLADFLGCCKCGLFCVEVNQMGQPHYHGWYQVDPFKELERIVYVKILQKYGTHALKITKALKVYPCSYRMQCNALHYYKKDVFDGMLDVVNNPISADTKDDTDWNLYSSYFFTLELDARGKERMRFLSEKISDRAYYRQFYTSSK